MTPKTRCQGTGQWLESHHEATITWGQIAKTTGWKARYFCRKNRLKFFSETQDVGHIQKKIFWMIWVSFHYTFMFEIWLQGRTPWNLLAKPKRVGKWIIIYLYYPYQKKKYSDFGFIPIRQFVKMPDHVYTLRLCLKMFSGCTYCSQPQTFQLYIYIYIYSILFGS